jgi:hypothetical protein
MTVCTVSGSSDDEPQQANTSGPAQKGLKLPLWPSPGGLLADPASSVCTRAPGSASTPTRCWPGQRSGRSSAMSSFR